MRRRSSCRGAFPTTWRWGGAPVHRPLDGRRGGKRWGLINEVVPANRPLVRARELADLLASGPPLVFAAIKEAVRETAHLAIQDAFDLVKGKRVAAVRTLYQSEDAKEGARAFAEKWDPVWKGR